MMRLVHAFDVELFRIVNRLDLSVPLLYALIDAVEVLVCIEFSAT